MKRLTSLLAMLLAFVPAVAMARQSSVPHTANNRNRVRIYFIAAEETQWDYAPSGRNEAMGMSFTAFEKEYMEKSAHKIGRVYEKAVYREYTDATFTKPLQRSGRINISEFLVP